jgi:hypothetical protein
MEILRPRIQQGLEEVQKVPVSVLLWGPAIDGPNPMASVRQQLRARLRASGHLAVINEELVDRTSSVSLRTQEFMHARNFDLVICIPASPGALAEAHEFATHPGTQCKMVLFMDRAAIGGFSEQSLATVSTVLTSQVEYYDGPENVESIYETTLIQVQRIREWKFMTSHKWA